MSEAGERTAMEQKDEGKLSLASGQQEQREESRNDKAGSARTAPLPAAAAPAGSADLSAPAPAAQSDHPQDGKEYSQYPRIHRKPAVSSSFGRLDMLWEKYPQFREKKPLPAMDDLLKEHESWQEDCTDEVRAEYESGKCGEFLVPLSRNDLSYRMETRKRIEEAPPAPENPYVTAFMEQFAGIDTARKAAFLFPESSSSMFLVLLEVCRRAEIFRPVSSLFPDEDRVHYLAVFDKRDMDDVLLMYHLVYGNPTDEMPGGYLLYDFPFPWYQSHLREKGTVLRSPYLPDRIAKYQGNLPFYFNPAKTVQVRKNISRILEKGYMASELDFFLNLTRIIMPFFQWWYADLGLYETKDGLSSDWRMEREKIRTDLTADGTILPKWKHELALFRTVRGLYPDTLYQHRAEWLGRQSLDLYIPSLKTAIEYQGIQHYSPVSFFGGDDALQQRQELDLRKKDLCERNGVRLIEWPYSLEPTPENVQQRLSGSVTARSSRASAGIKTERSSGNSHPG